MADNLVLTWTDGPIARISLNRPEKHNAKSLALIEALHSAVQEADADDNVRVIVLSGEGPSFSSGHDVTEVDFNPEVAKLYDTPEARLDTERRMYFQYSLDMRNTKKPTIAQVHGHCLAAGMMTIAMCDLVVASEEAQFGMPVLRRAAAVGEILFEPWEIGARRAKEFLFTGDPIDAQTALAWGFINRVVPRDQLDAAVRKLALRVADKPPRALALTKASINRTLDNMGQATSWEQHFMTHVFSHFTSEAISARGDRKEMGDAKSLWKAEVTH